MKHLLPALLLTLCIAGNAMAQVASRLKSSSFYSVDSSAHGVSHFLLDSMHYTYSGGRGSEVIFDSKVDKYSLGPYSLVVNAHYDEAVNVRYVPYLHSYSRYETNRTRKTYNNQNICETEQLDFWDTVTNTWIANDGKLQYSYNTDGTLAETISLRGATPDGRNVYEYDAQGNNTLITRYSYWQSTKDWHPVTRDTVAYDAGNHRIFWATQTPGKNNDWVLGEFTTCSYAPDGKLATYDVTLISGTIKLRFAYSQSADTAITTMEQWDRTGQFWFVSAISKELRDAGGRLTTVIRSARSSVPNSIMTTKVLEWKYNSYGQVTDYIQRSNYSPYNLEHTHYYYETYITGISAGTGSLYLLVYPSPASNVLHIGMTFANTREIQGSIINMEGKACAQWVDKVDGLPNLNKDIDVSNLACGTYFLRLFANGQSETKRFTIVR